ncbi:cell wall hydrolase [Caulobacter sp. Root342]|uniref:cell wall hydrolase n=1 Tax=Caulobacter sp. Root342 TaxID=1736519 RepID=UPI000AFBD159|nr:cell wall hydrolase [Caulobacter sp. Root342]
MRARPALCGLLGLLLSLQGGFARGEDLPGVARADLVAALTAPGAREAIARVAVAEAANQGDSGLLAVVYTIFNRLSDGRWGTSLDQVLNARAQFEPVLRAGGDWRALPAASPVQRARVNTLINLALEGRAPDPTGGALWFQNPRIVAARAAAGQVSARLVHFGGRTPSAVIGDHAFYPAAPVAGTRPTIPLPAQAPAEPEPIFVPRTALEPPAPPPSGARGLFVSRDGSLR